MSGGTSKLLLNVRGNLETEAIETNRGRSAETFYPLLMKL